MDRVYCESDIFLVHGGWWLRKRVVTEGRNYLSFLVFLSVSLLLYDLNRSIWINYNQTCELHQIWWSTWDWIQFSKNLLIMHLRVLICEEIFIFLVLTKFIIFGPFNLTSFTNNNLGGAQSCQTPQASINSLNLVQVTCTSWIHF